MKRLVSSNMFNSIVKLKERAHGCNRVLYYRGPRFSVRMARGIRDVSSFVECGLLTGLQLHKSLVTKTSQTQSLLSFTPPRIIEHSKPANHGRETTSTRAGNYKALPPITSDFWTSFGPK
jgi:hypothetical protein